LLFDSEVIGPFDNKWQLWWRASDKRFAIALSGTVGEAGSIIEGLISVMVQANGTLSLGSIDCTYKFAADPEAGVHLGFAVGTLLLPPRWADTITHSLWWDGMIFAPEPTRSRERAGRRSRLAAGRRGVALYEREERRATIAGTTVGGSDVECCGQREYRPRRHRKSDRRRDVRPSDGPR